MTLVLWIQGLDLEFIGKVIRASFDFALLFALLSVALKIIFLTQRTRAVGAGLVIIALFAIIAEYMDLLVVSKLVDRMILISIFVAVLLFQEELRQLLMQLMDIFRRISQDEELTRVSRGLIPFRRRAPGTPRWFQCLRRTFERTVEVILDSSFRPKEQGQVKVLVRAVDRLSKLGLGALIVVDRQGDVNFSEKEGIVLNAELSEDLLHSVFIPDYQNPLHDGACVVRGNKVAMAACILRLSTNPDIPLHFGTRHRAAIGFSEVTRAIILVVSEETGGCTVCHLGKWKSFKPVDGRLPLASLTEYLTRELEVRKEATRAAQDSAVPHRSQGNTVRTVIAGLVAALFTLNFWWSEFRAEQTEQTFQIPVVYGLNSNLHALNGPRTVNVTFSGTQSRIDKLAEAIESDRGAANPGIVVTACFPDDEPGTCRTDISAAENFEAVELRVPQLRRRFAQAKPITETFDVSVIELERVTLPIAVRYEGLLGSNFVRTGENVSPESIEVQIPKGARWDSILTEGVDLTGQERTFRTEVGLRPVSILLPDGEYSVKFDKKVTVEVEIEARERTRVDVYLPIRVPGDIVEGNALIAEPAAVLTSFTLDSGVKFDTTGLGFEVVDEQLTGMRLDQPNQTREVLLDSRDLLRLLPEGVEFQSLAQSRIRVRTVPYSEP